MANKRILELALKGLRAERDLIDKEIADIKVSLKGDAPAATASAEAAPAKRKRVLTAAGRRAISAALKKRWADKRAASN